MVIMEEESEKETYPTMNERKETEDKRLRQKYALIRQQWDDYKRTRTSRAVVKALKQLLLLQDSANSPRALMSSLQRYPMKVVRRKISNAVEDVFRERRAAIQSGRLKGRRLLFGEEEEEMVRSSSDDFVVEDSGGEEDIGQDVELGVCCHEHYNDEDEKGLRVDESFLMSQYPKSSSSSHSCFVRNECLERQMVDGDEGEQLGMGVKFGVHPGQGRRSRRLDVRFLVTFWLILFVIVIIFSNSYRVDFYCGRNTQVILVPT